MYRRLTGSADRKPVRFNPMARDSDMSGASVHGTDSDHAVDYSMICPRTAPPVQAHCKSPSDYHGT